MPAVTKRSEQLKKGSIKDKTMIAGGQITPPTFYALHLETGHISFSSRLLLHIITMATIRNYIYIYIYIYSLSMF